jgi:hypothetical protein
MAAVDEWAGARLLWVRSKVGLATGAVGLALLRAAAGTRAELHAAASADAAIRPAMSFVFMASRIRASAE